MAPLLSLVAACVEQAPVGPLAAGEARTLGAAHDRSVDLGTCDSLRVPANAKLALHVYAAGVQIYQWSGSAWAFVAPSATLFADPNGRSTVGTHYAGPTWESVSGSQVRGAVIRRCPGLPNAVPWLLLGAVGPEGPGIFHDVAFIQRINTVGGNAPGQAGAFVGEEARVPYQAEYLFYR